MFEVILQNHIKPVYFENIQKKKQENLKVISIDLVKDSNMAQLGLSEDLLSAVFEVPSRVDDAVDRVTLVVPLSNVEGEKAKVIAGDQEEEEEIARREARPVRREPTRGTRAAAGEWRTIDPTVPPPRTPPLSLSTHLR